MKRQDTGEWVTTHLKIRHVAERFSPKALSVLLRIAAVLIFPPAATEPSPLTLVKIAKMKPLPPPRKGFHRTHRFKHYKLGGAYRQPPPSRPRPSPLSYSFVTLCLKWDYRRSSPRAVSQSFTREELTRSYREPLWWDRLIGTPPSMRQVLFCCGRPMILPVCCNPCSPYLESCASSTNFLSWSYLFQKVLPDIAGGGLEAPQLGTRPRPMIQQSLVAT